MKHTKFVGIVKSPWVSGFHTTQKEFEPTSTVYNDGEFFVSKMFDASYLYFKRIGVKYYAFHNLCAFNVEHLQLVKAGLAGSNSNGWLVQRGVDCIKNWENKLL